MAIKNYTTTIDVYKSLGEIQGSLASHGARQIMVDYDGAGQPIGVMFGIETTAGPRGFALPANVEGVRAVFARQKLKAAPGQAERTAWRNVRDLIMAQMAIVGAGQVQAACWRRSAVAMKSGKQFFLFARLPPACQRVPYSLPPRRLMLT